MAQLHDIILRPVITERSALQQDLENTYVFQVGRDANKVQIKSAVESFFGVEVETVRTMVVRGKRKRFGRFQGRRSDWKKAYVKLAEGHTINLFDDEAGA
ncbi:MAG: 50S ribosomal protein L23 [Alphaproteobacteria bacterium]|nr:50S ribosomal protein L23 [Alphaproteobacteria bacterium]